MEGTRQNERPACTYVSLAVDLRRRCLYTGKLVELRVREGAKVRRDTRASQPSPPLNPNAQNLCRALYSKSERLCSLLLSPFFRNQLRWGLQVNIACQSVTRYTWYCKRHYTVWHGLQCCAYLVTVLMKASFRLFLCLPFNIALSLSCKDTILLVNLIFEHLERDARSVDAFEAKRARI